MCERRAAEAETGLFSESEGAEFNQSGLNVRMYAKVWFFSSDSLNFRYGGVQVMARGDRLECWRATVLEKCVREWCCASGGRVIPRHLVHAVQRER